MPVRCVDRFKKVKLIGGVAAPARCLPKSCGRGRTPSHRLALQTSAQTAALAATTQTNAEPCRGVGSHMAMRPRRGEYGPTLRPPCGLEWDGASSAAQDGARWHRRRARQRQRRNAPRPPPLFESWRIRPGRLLYGLSFRPLSKSATACGSRRFEASSTAVRPMLSQNPRGRGGFCSVAQKRALTHAVCCLRSAAESAPAHAARSVRHPKAASSEGVSACANVCVCVCVNACVSE